MKFQKYLSSVEQTFHYTPLTQTCIPYKKWKKVIKYHAYPWSLEDLEHQCQAVEQTFHQSLKAYHRHKNPRWRPNPFKLFDCCHSRKHFSSIVPEDPEALTPKELIAFAEVNAQAVYKVCKKLEKTKEVTGAMKFLESLRTSHKYSFMGSHRTTQLHLSDPDDPIDRTCPICFEDLGNDATSQTAIVLPCGHYQCFACFCQMTSYHRIPATFHTRMCIVGYRFSCPMCRMRPTGDFMRQIAFWPSPPEDAAKGAFLPPIQTT